MAIPGQVTRKTAFLRFQETTNVSTCTVKTSALQHLLIQIRLRRFTTFQRFHSVNIHGNQKNKYIPGKERTHNEVCSNKTHITLFQKKKGKPKTILQKCSSNHSHHLYWRTSRNESIDFHAVTSHTSCSGKLSVKEKNIAKRKFFSVCTLYFPFASMALVKLDIL